MEINKDLISEATTSEKGLMSASDKEKLDVYPSSLYSLFSNIPSTNNIDTLRGTYIAIVPSDAGGTKPTTIGGNRFLVIGFSAGSSGLSYGVQLAIGFGGTSIAVRNCNYNSSGTGTWGSWRYI